MTQDELAALQLAYGRAAYEAERWASAAKLQKQRLDEAAELDAHSDYARSSPRDLRKPSCYCGLYASLAKALGVARSTVTRVARGEIKNDRIEKALREEIERAESERVG